jgi:branched-chain amino acid transport system ATP-binding protein
MPSGVPALELDQVTVSFAGLTAVDHVSLSFPAGQRCAIIGPNGAGKTSLFRAISGETKMAAGTVSLLGRDVTRAVPEQRAARGLGRTYQVTSLFGGLTVEQNVVMALLSRRRSRHCFWRRLRLDDALEARVGSLLSGVLLADRRDDVVALLSHGEQRQLELAVALAGDPDVLLLDEPAAGLSGPERAMLAEVIGALDRDLTLLIIDHDIDLVFGMAERAVCMDNGVVIADGSPRHVRADDRVRNVYLGLA